MLRVAIKIVGGLAIVAASFFGTLFVMDLWQGAPSPDSIRADHIRQIEAALEDYRTQKGRYPSPFFDNPLTDIQALLAVPLPRDPRGGANDYRYVSSIDGKRYGLLFHLSDGSTCIAGVNWEGTGWWQATRGCQ